MNASPPIAHHPPPAIRSAFALMERPGVSQGKPQAFTLIELLVVIGIMAVMLSIALPAFTGLGKGTGMRAAVADVRTTISLARQWAITHHDTVYVVFPSRATSYAGTAQGEVKKANRAYAVFARKSGYINEWKYLPAGIIFDDNVNAGTSIFNPSPGFGDTSLEWPPGNLVSASSALNVIGFKPAGNSVESLSDMYVPIREGIITADTNTGNITEYVINPNNPGFNVYVSSLVGGVKVVDQSQ